MINIRFVTDYVCPNCYLTKIALRQALAGREYTIQWLPMELTPPPAPRIDTYHDTVRQEKWAHTLHPAAQALGIAMKLPPKVVPRPYTHLAFLGYHYAAAHGAGERYHDLVEDAYFLAERDIGDPDELCRIAADAGLSAADFRQSIQSGEYEAIQSQSNFYARETLAVTGIPTLWLDNRRIEGGLYTAAAFTRLLDEAQSPQPGARCTPDGCK